MSFDVRRGGSELESTRAARSEHERHKRTQQSYLSTHERVETP